MDRAFNVVWSDGKALRVPVVCSAVLPYPCPDAMRKALPYRYRKAFDRANNGWIHRRQYGHADDVRLTFLPMRTRRGKVITLYAFPVRPA